MLEIFFFSNFFQSKNIQYNQDGPIKEEIDNTKKPDQVLFYVLAGIIAVILICIFAVVMILKKYSVKDQSKPYDSEDPNFQSAEDFDIIDITDQDMMVPRNRERKDDVTLPTFYKVSHFSLFFDCELCSRSPKHSFVVVLLVLVKPLVKICLKLYIF